MSSISDKVMRVDRYRPPDAEEQFLATLNQRLCETPPAQRPQRPTLFVAGGPRTGTTFLAQCVSHAFDVAYIDHLAAKFWLAPVTGYRLARSTFGDQRASTFRSEFGRTDAPTDIHGFHYFWIHHLRLDHPDTLFTDPGQRGIDPAVINSHLAALQDVADRPFVFKGYYPAYFMKWFADHVPGCVFLLTDRDPLAQARSIYRARMTYMRSVEHWWSMLPPEHDELRTLPVAEQIAGQIFGLRRMYARQMRQAKLPVIVVPYDRLVNDMAGTLAELARSIEGLTGERLASTGVMPQVRASGSEVPEAVEAQLADAIQRYAHWDEPWNP